MRYVHTQLVPSTTWTVTHNLNTLQPIVEVFVNFQSQLQKILPQSVIITDINTITILFSQGFSGEVRIVT